MIARSRLSCEAVCSVCPKALTLDSKLFVFCSHSINAHQTIFDVSLTVFSLSAQMPGSSGMSMKKTIGHRGVETTTGETTYKKVKAGGGGVRVGSDLLTLAAEPER